MFQELSKHLDKVNLVITLSKQDDSDKILYSILPKTKDNKDLGIIPLAGSGTAEELEAELPGIIEQAFSGQNSKTLSNLAAFTASLQKAEDSKSRTSAATTSTTSGSKGATKGSTTPSAEPEKPKVVNSAILKGAEQKAWKQAQALLQQAVGKTDLDVINYLEKQAEAEAIKVKSQPVAIQEIKNAFADIRTKLETAKTSQANDGLFAGATIVDDKTEANKLVNEAQKDAATVSVPALETTPETPKAETPKAVTKATTQASDPFAGSVEITDEDFDDDEEEDEELTGIAETEVNDSANSDEIDVF